MKSSKGLSIKVLRKALSAGCTLALRSIRMQVREHAFGYGWALIIPVLYAVCYIFIKRELTGHSGALTADVSWDVLRAFTGITLFQCWMNIVQEMSDFIRRQKGLLRGLNVGPTPFVLAILLEGALAIIIRAVLIIIAMPCLGLSLPASIVSWFWFFASFFILLISAATLGLLLAPWSVLYADVRKGLSSISLPFVLVSPIFYPALENADSAMYWINLINPIASPLAVISTALQDQVSTLYSLPMFLAGGGSIFVMFWLLILVRRQIPILLERM